MQPCESVALRTLQSAIISLPEGQVEVKILLYDNTPGGQTIGEVPEGVLYKADFGNGALSAACNYALEVAEKKQFDWLLTLNQDTTLPNDFLCKLRSAVMLVASMPDIAGIVPSISSDGREVSPYIQMKYWTFTRRIPVGFIGIPLENVYAANSVSTIKVSALKVIGGFDPRFSLDLVDFDIDYRLHRKKLRFFVAGNIHVGLELSSHDLKRRSSPERYEDYLRAEEVYCDEYLGNIVSMVVVVKLIYRMGYKLWRSGGSLAYYRIALRFLCRRLFNSRKHRMENWKPIFGKRT
jgi:GT2 family glycosyltransferase